MQSAVGKWRALTRGEEGSITLEASIVFPWVMIATFVLILLALFLARHVLTYYAASTTVERAAFTWSNSSKELRTGAFPKGRYDGLYWRLTDDALLAGLFGWSTDEGNVGVPIEAGDPNRDGSSSEEKLRKTGHAMFKQIQGTLGYRNSGWKREIWLDSSGSKIPEAIRRFRSGAGGDSQADVAAVVAEPTEMIRSFDLVRYYQSKLKSKEQGAGAYRGKAAAVLENKR